MLNNIVKVFMPHIILEYSTGVEALLDVQALVDNIHSVALDNAHIPSGGIRVRAHVPSYCRVADGAEGREFIYVIVRLGFGRTDDVKRQLGETFFNVLTKATQLLFDQGQALSLGLEVQEIARGSTWKKNNIHQIIKDSQNDESS